MLPQQVHIEQARTAYQQALMPMAGHAGEGLDRLQHKIDTTCQGVGSAEAAQSGGVLEEQTGIGATIEATGQ